MDRNTRKNVAIPGDKRANLTQDNSSNHWQCFKQWDANGGGVTTSQAVLVGKIILQHYSMYSISNIWPYEFLVVGGQSLSVHCGLASR